jgi:hypothetical protein
MIQLNHASNTTATIKNLRSLLKDKNVEHRKKWIEKKIEYDIAYFNAGSL